MYYNFSMPPDIQEGKEEELASRELKSSFGEKKKFVPPSLLLFLRHKLATFMADKDIRKRFFSAKSIKTKIAPYMKCGLVEDYVQYLHGDAQSSSFRQTAGTFAFVDTEEVICKFVKLNPSAVDTFVYFIEANEVLRSLVLAGNKLQPCSFECITSAIHRQTWPLLTHLDLSYNEFHPDHVGKKTIDEISMCCLSCPRLEVLKLAGCKITSELAPVLLELIVNTKSIRELDLGFNLLQAEGAEYIAEALENNSTLTSLNLRQNGVGSLGHSLFLLVLFSILIDDSSLQVVSPWQSLFSIIAL